MSTRVEKAADRKGQPTWDILNDSGIWLGWITNVNGELTLMSTSAALTDHERASLARTASECLGKTVQS